MPIYQPKDSAPWIRQLNANKALSLNNTYAVTNLFSITGTVAVAEIYAVVTTVFSSNITNWAFCLGDGTAITNTSGLTLSSLPVGSIIYKLGGSATVASSGDSSQCRVLDPGSAGTNVGHPFMVQKQSASANYISFAYGTTNAPSSGNIDVYVVWRPMSSGATLTNV